MPAAPVEFAALNARHGTRRVLHGIHLQVDAGTKVAICGSNGSGKSTLLRTLLGLHPVESGQVRVDGRHPGSRREWRSRRLEVAYVPQRPAVGRFPLLVGELLRSSGDDAAARHAASELGVVHLAERSVDSLSGGQLQRVFLARGIACARSRASVLVADEPTSALDFAGQDEVAALLGDLEVTVIVVTHAAVVVERCERVVDMADGVLRERT